MGVDKTVSEDKKRWIMSIRTTADGRRRLEEAAEANGRNLSEEIENRLQRSFQTDDDYGGFANAAFVNFLGATIREIEATTGQSWRSDTKTLKQVSQSILRELESRGPGIPKVERRTRKIVVANSVSSKER